MLPLLLTMIWILFTKFQLPRFGEIAYRHVSYELRNFGSVTVNSSYPPQLFLMSIVFAGRNAS